MIVAITGANGFIGRNLVDRFAELRWDVRSIVRRDYDTGDSALESRMAGADVLVHAAGATRAVSVHALRNSNVHLTERTLEVARRAGVCRVVFISSQAAAGPASSRDLAIDETSECAPVEAYGQSKLDAERLVQQPGALPWVILRPAAVYGPGDRDFLAMFRLARRGLAIHPGNRKQWISIVHVRDLADAVVRASTTSAMGKAFFIANDEPTQWRQLFRECSSAVSSRLGMDIQVPLPLVKLGATLGDLVARVTGRAGLLTSGKVALSRPSYWVCSNGLARRELGWTPTISLDDGLRETYEWYREQGWL